MVGSSLPRGGQSVTLRLRALIGGGGGFKIKKGKWSILIGGGEGGF